MSGSQIDNPVDSMDKIGRDILEPISVGAPVSPRSSQAPIGYVGQSAQIRPAREGSTISQKRMMQLVNQGFSRGLAKALVRNADEFHQRIWVVDNSGSMQIGDGHRIIDNGDMSYAALPSTRWEEIQDTVLYHASMAALLKAPTVFRLLNDPGLTVGPQEFSVAGVGGNSAEEIQNAQRVMQLAKPDGVTPLVDHIRSIHKYVRSILPQLRAMGQRVAVILATDGLPTDANGYGGEEITNQFLGSLRSLEGLPIWLVIRLCTDEAKVTEFYNELDGLLELSLEVLDDFLGEAEEVYRFNPWLNYALPLHRCRELGYHDRLFDLIDERPLTPGELREFCALLFGDSIEKVPDPAMNWKSFSDYVEEQLSSEQLQWNPIKKKKKPWINVKAMTKRYQGGCVIQ